MTWRRLIRRVFSWHNDQPLRDSSWLDGLRGIAAFEVMITHYQGVFGFSVLSYGTAPDAYDIWRLPLFRPLYHSGNAMVCVFFVISGYVLSLHSLRLLRAGELERFYEGMSSAIFRRYLRLFLPSMISTIFAFFLVCVGIEGTGPNGIPPNLPTVREQFTHYMIENARYLNILNYPTSLVGLTHRYSNVIWTIPVEYVCSLILFVTILGTARLPGVVRNYIVLTIDLLALASGHWEVFCFLSGLLLADFDEYSLTKHSTNSPISSSSSSSGAQREEEKKGTGGVRRHKMVFIILFFTAYIMVGLPIRTYPGQRVPGYNLFYSLVPEHHFSFDLHRTIWAYASILLVFSIPRVPILKVILEAQVCQWLGKLSFSMYLVHMMVVHTFGTPLKRMLYSQLVLTDSMIMKGEDASEIGVAMAYFLWMPWMCCISLLAASGFYKLVDRWSIKATRRVEERAKSGEFAKRLVNPVTAFEDVKFEVRW